MNTRIFTYRHGKGVLSLFALFIVLAFTAPLLNPNIGERTFSPSSSELVSAKDYSAGIKIISGTYLGNEERNYYGNIAPSTLDLIWRIPLGSGMTRVGSNSSPWSGAGWTGQPLLVIENGKLVIIQGSFDWNLKKIDAITGDLIWQYAFDDILKGTGSLWINPDADSLDQIVIMQGSRQGFHTSFTQSDIPSFRAVSFRTGKELWRINSKHTSSYSRDVDASPLVINDTAYIGLENGIFTVFNPGTVSNSGSPEILEEHWLYNENDKLKHGGNLVTEASPARLGNHIYICSGSGHVFGYNLDTDSIDWDFYTGADMDGSPVVTSDSCIIITIEKQYIAGNGGVMKLNPAMHADSAVVWFFPTGNVNFFSWQGGVVGSASINDCYVSGNESKLASFIGIDGYLYVVEHTRTEPGKIVKGPDNKTTFPAPVEVFRYKTGPGISTPVMTNDRIVAGNYAGIHLFGIGPDNAIELIDYKNIGCVESTPVFYNHRIYVASRDGYLYCLGSENGSPIAGKGKSIFEKWADETSTICYGNRNAKLHHVKMLWYDKPTQDSTGVYYTIAGSFRDFENAIALRDKLQALGYPSEIAGKRNGLFLVSYRKYFSRSEAKSDADKLRSLGAEAWVFRYHAQKNKL